jgi:hypothetical protein
MDPIPVAGRVVLFRLNGSDEYPVLRPATIVNAFGSPDCANIVVQLDAANDRRELLDVHAANYGGLVESFVDQSGTIRCAALHKSPATKGEGIGQWRWPTRVG